MALYRGLVCDNEARRAQLQTAPNLHGIDYIEVVTEPPADNQRLLRIFFIPKTTNEGRTNLSEMLNALRDATDKITIEGGVRVRDIKVTAVKQVEDHLEVRVSEPGDFSTYTLSIDRTKLDPTATLDPAYARCDFSFKAGCPSRFDCRPREGRPTIPRVQPVIDYMAKDYASFRQALVDLIPSLVPDWEERHEADVGILLLELLAYLGDQLSYYQDAVANEAYLETARQRVSVRRHARLIDYCMHDGVSARAFIHFRLAKGTSGTLPAGTQVLTRIDAPLGSKRPPHGRVITSDLKDQALEAAGAVFETITEAHLHANLNKLNIHTWRNRQCCLPPGTTTVDLAGDLTAQLQPGDFLLFEEAKGRQSGLEAEADLTRRQVVRLTDVHKTEDPLPDPETHNPVILTRVTWDSADALASPLCVSGKLTRGPRKDEYEPAISVARGNLVLADHGCKITEWHPGDPGHDPAHPLVAGIQVGERAYRFRLREGPLSFRMPTPTENGSPTPVKELLITDPRQAVAQATLNLRTRSGTLEPWNLVPNLLQSGPFDRDFVAEPDNEGRAVIRFGDDQFGRAPPDDTHVCVTYRVGVGPSGNVGSESLKHAIHPGTATDWPDIEDIYNPLPAWGGTAPESMEQVRQLAPAAFHADLFRAVTERDYALAAEKHPAVSKAVATFRWTGSWHTVFVTIDPVGRTDVSSELEQRVRAWVNRYTQAGYDLEIEPPTFVPLDIEIDVCVAPDHFRAHVEEALLVALSNQPLPDGGRGFFHPDNFTFGQPLHLSQLYAAVRAVEGVDSAVITKFQRYGKASRNELEQGYIFIDRLEVAQLDNDLNFPENGVLRLNMRGGK